MEIKVENDGKGNRQSFSATWTAHAPSGRNFFYSIEVIGWGATEEEARINLTKAQNDIASLLP